MDSCGALSRKAGGSSVLRFPVLDKSMPAVRGGREDCMGEKGEGERWERREEKFGGRGASVKAYKQPPRRAVTAGAPSPAVQHIRIGIEIL